MHEAVGMRSSRPSLFALPVAVALAAALAVPAPCAAAQSGVEAVLQARLERLAAEGAIGVGGVRVQRDPRLHELYARRGFAPAWDAARAAALPAAIGRAAEHGLTPAHYHLAALEALGAAAGRGPGEAADLDLLQSVALLALAHDLRFGRIAPAERDPPASAASLDLSLDLAALLAAPDLAAAVDALAPNHYAYRGLRQAFARYREIAAGGGFPALGEGPALRRGERDPRVPALRRRLVASGDLAAADALESDLFDTALERAVKRFQHRHGLNDDGVAGPSTQAEMAVPVEVRIGQVRANLERARWILREAPAEAIVVNVAAQRLYVVRGGEVAWETRVVVGRLGTRTPTFRSVLSEVILNPPWSVPASIAPEVVADARRDPDYLTRQGFRVLDAAGGQVAAEEVERALGAEGSFPYRLRQSPGRANALGHVKFQFDNPYGVYLHDTPARGLFAREHRTFSHGCIRVEDPLRLAELALADPAWDRQALEAAVARGGTRSLRPVRPLPVLVLYWTAAADLHGELHLYRDVYGRDPGLLEALDRP